jgi:hypothetical protein
MHRRREFHGSDGYCAVRLLAAGRTSFYRARLSALGWSSERIADVRLGQDEIVINVESDAVTIVRESDWGGMRKVYRGET